MEYKNFLYRTSVITVSAMLCLSLTACQTTQKPNADTMSKINSVMANAAASADGMEISEASMELEEVYKRDSGNHDVATKYAKSLREDGRFNRASAVLTAAANDTKNPHYGAKVEYASLMAAMGRYDEAESYASDAVLLQPETGQAYHVLGVALDAQGHHKQAETAFRKALDFWEGDSSSLLNNLGLNLAAQGFIDEALETLRKAKVLSPNKREIERNIRIVSSLQYAPPQEGTRLVPKPPRKPSKDEEYSLDNVMSDVESAGGEAVIEEEVITIEETTIEMDKAESATADPVTEVESEPLAITPAESKKREYN